MDLIEKAKSAFLNFTVYDGIDIVVVAVVIYYMLKLLKHNNVLRLSWWILPFIVFGVVFSSKALSEHLHASPLIFGAFVMVCVLVIFSVFQNEIKRIFWKIASPKKFSTSYNEKYACTQEQIEYTIAEIVKVTQTMSKKKVGALMVIVPSTIEDSVVDSGTLIEGILSSYLIESIFVTKGPMHDGAILIKNNTVVAAGCLLPLYNKQDIPKNLGTRHRAAIGITENKDTLCIVCSEETGVISVARDGQLKQYLDSVTLTDMLKKVYGLKATDTKSNR